MFYLSGPRFRAGIFKSLGHDVRGQLYEFRVWKIRSPDYGDVALVNGYEEFFRAAFADGPRHSRGYLAEH